VAGIAFEFVRTQHFANIPFVICRTLRLLLPTKQMCLIAPSSMEDSHEIAAAGNIDVTGNGRRPGPVDAAFHR
jgi:hypothetical protein